MNLALYFLIGLFATFIGAIPLGTVNLSVINTTLKQDARTAMKIAMTAGVAEILLTLFALHCSTNVTHFIDDNNWIQFAIAAMLFLAGVLLFFKKQKETNTKPKSNKSKFFNGFILGLLNPPVLVYWILAISYIDMNALSLNMTTSLSILFVFFTGVYVGKIGTLYLYSRLSTVIKNHMQNVSLIMNKVIGVLLVFIGLIQTVKLVVVV